MTQFLGGILFGACFMGAGLVVYFNRLHRQKHEPEPWREDAWQQPIVTTKIVNRHRSIEL